MLYRLILIFVTLLGLPAQAFDTRATAAWVFDETTQTVLLAKNADVPLPPASMSKLMTLNMLFEALQDGRVTMDTTFAVSTRARSMGGSTMFLNERDRPTVRDGTCQGAWHDPVQLCQFHGLARSEPPHEHA